MSPVWVQPVTRKNARRPPAREDLLRAKKVREGFMDTIIVMHTP
jgi:hypothetical protein